MPNNHSRIVRFNAFASRLSAPTRASVMALSLSLFMGAAVSAQQTGDKNDKAQPADVSSASAAPYTNISLLVDGENRAKQTQARTVADFLKEEGVKLSPLDRVSPSPKTLLSSNLSIVIVRIRREEVIERTAIPFSTKQKYTASLSVGSKNVLTPGKNGERVKKFTDIYKNEVRTAHSKTAERITAPRPQIEQVGTRGMTLASRGFFGGRRVVEMVATGYGPGENGRWGAQTASGLKPGFGVVAVDPRFIPLGTRLYIDGYGYAVAGDTGGAIKGNRIDLGFDNYSTAQNVGRRKVRVLILN